MKKIRKDLLLLGCLMFMSNSIKAYDIEADGIYYNLNINDRTLSVTRHYYYEGYINIPDEVEYNTQRLKVVKIEKDAFKECPNLRSVTIGNNVATIESYAFQKSGIQSVIIGNGVTSIGMDAFSSCKYLQKVEMGGNVERISAFAFAYSPLLEEITLPSSCKEVGLEAFKNCSGLKRVVIEDSKEPLSFETSFYTEENIFDGCKIEYVYQGRNTKRKENNVKCYMFGHGTIKEVAIGANVTKVDDFQYSTSIETVRSYILNPQTIAQFSNTTYASAKLIVPIGTKELYEKSDDWGKFFNIVEEDMSGIGYQQLNQIGFSKVGNQLIIKGVPFGEKIEVIDYSGRIISSTISQNYDAYIEMTNKNGAYLIKIGQLIFKIR